MRLPGRTLQSRIVWTTTIGTALSMLAVLGVVLWVLTSLAKDDAERRIADQAAAVATTIRVGSDGTVTAPVTPDRDIDATTWIYDTEGRLLVGPVVRRRTQEVVESLSSVVERTRVERNERVFLALPVQVDGRPRAVVVVAASLEPYESTRTVVLVGLVGVGALVTAGSAAVSRWAVRRTLAPVGSMASRADDWSEHALDTRFDVTGTQDEFAHLGRTLNVLLDRVAGALRSEQRLTAELAHELRTPLTAIRGEAELARMRPLPPEVDERLERVVERVDGMSETIASLLAVARGEDQPASRTSVRDVVGALRTAVAPRPGVTLALPDDEAPILQDVALAAPLGLAVRAVVPVLENAVRHAAGRVTVTIVTGERVVDLVVDDDGPGLGSADPDALFESGTREEGSDGAGLGLALARRVAETVGGTVAVASPSGPTRFVVSLPRF
jgi:signal transduction histidine kinase